MTDVLFVLFLIAALYLLSALRADGDESVGFGGTYVADGVNIPNVETLGVPTYTTGTVDSKTLDLPAATIRKLATLLDGGSFQVKWHLTQTPFTKMEALRIARSKTTHTVTIPIDAGTLSISIPGIVTENKIDDLEAEKITMVTSTIVVAGPPA